MLIYWIWFAQLKKLSCAQKHLLLQYFQNPEDIYHAHSKAFANLEGVTREMLGALEDKELGQAEQILEDCNAKGIGILTLADRDYPYKLKNIFEAPLVLYYRGKLPNWEAQPIISVVGTRKATSHGMRAAQRFGREVAACGGLVFSGGAAGVDTMALEGALAAGRPVGCVFGCGVDVAYPAKNRRLFEEIAQRGCLISEYPPKTEANGWHFPQRNRILSGISNGVLVVEAPAASGALITARLALEQGRDVFVVPGNAEEEACAGSNGLLQDCGIAALSGWDVMKEYAAVYPGIVARRDPPQVFERHAVQAAQEISLPKPPDKKSVDKAGKSAYSVDCPPIAKLSQQEQAVLEKIPGKPVIMDTVLAASELPAGTVKGILTRLTIKGYVQNHPGGRISRKS